jgi:hypothetical protein
MWYLYRVYGQGPYLKTCINYREEFRNMACVGIDLPEISHTDLQNVSDGLYYLCLS